MVLLDCNYAQSREGGGRYDWTCIFSCVHSHDDDNIYNWEFLFLNLLIYFGFTLFNTDVNLDLNNLF